jgi:hypothetical protein
MAGRIMSSPPDVASGAWPIWPEPVAPSPLPGAVVAVVPPTPDVVVGVEVVAAGATVVATVGVVVA